MEGRYAWGGLLVGYSEGGEDLALEEVTRQIAAIVEGIERGPGQGEEDAWIAAVKEALGTAHVARVNGSEACWDPVGEAFAAQYGAGATHCHRAVEAIVADANAHHAAWEIEDRVKHIMPHGRARATLTIGAGPWNVETPEEQVEDLARSVAAAVTERNMDGPSRQRLGG